MKITTIAANLESIAADTWVTWDGGIGYATPKLFQIGNSVFGTAGDWFGAIFIEWAQGGFKAKTKPQFYHTPAWENIEFDILELAPDGLFLWDGHLCRTKVNNNTYAVGSGSQIAVVGMLELGMTPEQSVLLACKYNEYTKEPVDVVYLKDVKTTKT